jgi:hypothetical protein
MSFIFNLNKKERHCFLHIPKNAGKSLTKTLRGFNPFWDKGHTPCGRPSRNLIGHLTYNETNNILKLPPFNLTDRSRLKYFCIIRNPWERMVSWYNYINKNEFNVHGVPWPANQSFKEFVYTVTDDTARRKHAPRGSNDPRHPRHNELHDILRPQIDYIVDHKGDIVVDALLLHNINKDLSSFLIKNNISKKIVMERINTTSHKHYSVYYDDETIQAVRDFELPVIKAYNIKYEEIL